MSRVVNIIFLIVGFCILASCTIESTKEDGDYTRDFVNGLAHEKYLTPFYRVVEMSDFFDRYQNRLPYSQGAADSLATEYFGDCLFDAELDEGHFYSDKWGSIFTTEKSGEYTANAPVSGWSWSDNYLTYDVSATGNRAYAISCDEQIDTYVNKGEGKISLKSNVNVVGDECYVSYLRMNYSEILNDGGVLNIAIRGGTDSETIKFRLCKDGEYRSIPSSGVLYYTVTGDVTDEFSVVFYEYYYDIIITDGASSSYLSF